MHFNALDLNLIRVFDALMRERSATRAGDRIGLSQPAVSAALSRLRHGFNDQLFIRRGNEMVPTPRAEELGPLARSALMQIEQMVEPPGPFDARRLERTFTLMGSDFVSILMMPELVTRVGALAPGASLRLRDTAIGDIPRVLRDDLIDLAIEPPVPDLPETVSSMPIFVSPFAMVAARGHAALAAAGLAEGDMLTVETYCGLRHALRSVDGTSSGAVDTVLETLGLTRNVVLTLPHFEAVALTVSRSDLVAALPVQFARAAADRLGLALYRLPFDVPPPVIQMLWHSRHDNDRAHRFLREQIVAAVAGLSLDLAELPVREGPAR